MLIIDDQLTQRPQHWFLGTGSIFSAILALCVIIIIIEYL